MDIGLFYSAHINTLYDENEFHRKFHGIWWAIDTEDYVQVTLLSKTDTEQAHHEDNMFHSCFVLIFVIELLFVLGAGLYEMKRKTISTLKMTDQDIPQTGPNSIPK